MELITLIKEIAGLGALGLFLALFVILYLKERAAHDKTKDKYVATALAVKGLFHKVVGTMKIIGDENSTDFEDTKHRLDKIEETLETIDDKIPVKAGGRIIMAFWNKKKSPSKSDTCEELDKELQKHHKEFDEFDQTIRGIQSKRNGRKYITPSKDLDNEEEALTA